MTDTVKIEAPRNLVEKLRKHGVDVEKIVSEALIRADKANQEELKRSMDEASKILQKVSDEDIVKAIRKSRDEH